MMSEVKDRDSIYRQRAERASHSQSQSQSQSHSSSSTGQSDHEEEEMMAMNSDLRRGPWMVEEDFKLMNYIATNGEGRWNSLARCAGLKRTGKSCRLRWLNYLRPDVRRGNITLEEQLMILELHSRWGNRWSKIAQHLPGRTDNEIKNYWRTRVQKHAKQLKCDVNSKQFKDTMRYLWMPRLVERIQAAASSSTTAATTAATTANITNHVHRISNSSTNIDHMGFMAPNGGTSNGHATPDNSCAAGASSDSFGTQVSPVSDMTTDYYNIPVNHNPNPDLFQATAQPCYYPESIISPTPYFTQGLDLQAQLDQQNNNQWLDGGDTSDNLWNAEDIWFLQHLNNNM